MCQANVAIAAMKFLGEESILHLPKVGFLCSQRCPSHLILKSYDWVIRQREEGICVVSGFDSKIEWDVLGFLLKGNQPIIMVLARNMKRRFPVEVRKAIDKKRLLIISPFSEKVKEKSKISCYKRNETILKIVDEIVIGYAHPRGQLEKLLKINKHKGVSYLSDIDRDCSL